METAKAYDSMPYPTKFFTQTHPDRLATLGSIFGIDTKAPNDCRVLELGCGNGSNLLSHAYNLKDSSFVGVDISGKHIEEAKKSSEILNLTNIEFHKIDLMEMTLDDYGKFDYITAHGLISWIPEDVREKVFSIFHEMLEADGIGYTSYNAYPGAHYRDMVRRMMRFHTIDIDEPQEKVQESIKFLSFLTENSNEKKVFQPILENELKRHFQHDASDIYHDDLADCYQPFYIHEFAKELNNKGLQFLCEAELQAMSIQSFPPNVQEFLNKKTDIIEKEQYLDYFHGRIFRQSLFCHKEIKVNRKTDAQILDNYLLASSVKAANNMLDISDSKAERFIDSKGFGIEIDHPPTKTALKLLGEIWGKAVSTKQLLQTVRQQLEATKYKTENWEKEFDVTKIILFQIYQGTDLLELKTFQNEALQDISEMPKVNDLCTWQSKNADNVTSLYYINLRLDDEVSRYLISLLDGTRNRAKIIDDIKTFIKSNDKIKDKEELLDDIENWLNESLIQLAQLGMFVS